MKKVIVGLLAMLFSLQVFAQSNTGIAVDLGLPSGVLWSDRNIGASLETGSGLYLAFGELHSKSNYCAYNYAFYDKKQTVIPDQAIY